jgi:hypothetical protein
MQWNGHGLCWPAVSCMKHRDKRSLESPRTRWRHQVTEGIQIKTEKERIQIQEDLWEHIKEFVTE